MYLAIGAKSETVYAKGESKSDILRYLQAKYPYQYIMRGNTENQFETDGRPVLPETILIKREVEL